MQCGIIDNAELKRIKEMYLRGVKAGCPVTEQDEIPDSTPYYPFPFSYHNNIFLETTLLPNSIS
jgi:hypothetical protein